MASEQTGVKKKQLKSIPREEQSHPILYRHQDCIPSAKLLQNCEKFNSVGLKSNSSQECCKRLENREEFAELKNNKRKSPHKVKKNGITESNPQSVNVKNINGTDGGQDEILSRSRKRRIRKQKLLESLVSSSSNIIEPSPLIQNNTQIKSIPVSHGNNLGIAVSSSSKSAGESSKTSPKDPRKRPDKSGSRSKSIKSKPLVDQTNQTKASIIKTLEEKTLNSLLQTLAPFAHSSPKKEKASPIKPPFSFPDNRLSVSESKADKDGVFYFGETKHQLEKLTAELNKSSQNPSLTKEKSDNAQVEASKTSCLGSALRNLPNSISKNNISFTAFDRVKNNTLVTTLSTTPTESVTFPNKTDIGIATAGCSFKNENLNINKDQIVIPKSLEFIPSKELESILITAVKSLEKPQNNVDKICEASSSSEVLKAASTILKERSEEKSILKMKLEEHSKPNKTREEVLKEREAKKAAKMAAKSKHKAGKSNEEDVKDGTTSKLDSSISVNTINSEEIQKDEVLENKRVDGIIQQNKGLKAVTEKISDVKIEVLTEPAASKSKSELKAERRAKQEAQRAVKAAEKEPKKQIKEKLVDPVKPISAAVQPSKKSDAPKSSAQSKPRLFGHLYHEKTHPTSNEILKGGSLHPAIMQLGVQYSTRVVIGSNARCVALLCALKQVVNDYTTPSEKEFARGVEEELGLVTRYLNHCRPLAVSMTNALRHIKRSLTQLPNNISDKEARSKICEIIDQYIHEQIDTAGKAICNTVKEKILDGDVVLTYGCSSLVYQILLESHMKGTKFRVVVVDGRPWLEGREMLRKLVNKGLSCTYVLITAASFIMREATKVLLGAHALLANGCVMSRAGSSQVALLAHCNNVPVLVCCETHKFSERVQTDAFVYNEIEELSCDGMKERVTPLSLAYDITPPDLVSAVVTELAVLPCTSVPVILRIKPSESVI